MKTESRVPLMVTLAALTLLDTSCDMQCGDSECLFSDEEWSVVQSLTPLPDPVPTPPTSTQPTMPPPSLGASCSSKAATQDRSGSKARRRMGGWEVRGIRAASRAPVATSRTAGSSTLGPRLATYLWGPGTQPATRQPWSTLPTTISTAGGQTRLVMDSGFAVTGERQ